MSLRPMMQRDQASAMLGMVVEHDAPGESRVSMTVRDDMLNGFAITHGGLVFTLADTAFAIACNEDERVTVAGGADITFLKSTTAGQTLTATASRRARSGRTGLYDIRVTDETGELVAEVRGRSITTDRRPPAAVAERVDGSGPGRVPVPSTGSGTSAAPVAEPVEASGPRPGRVPVPSTGSGTSAAPVAEPVEASGPRPADDPERVDAFGAGRVPVPSAGSGTSAAPVAERVDASGPRPADDPERVDASGAGRVPVPSTGSGTSAAPVAEPVEASGPRPGRVPVPSTGSGTSAAAVAERVDASGAGRVPVPSTGSGTSAAPVAEPVDASGPRPADDPERNAALTTTEVSR